MWHSQNMGIFYFLLTLNKWLRSANTELILQMVISTIYVKEVQQEILLTLLLLALR